MKHVAENHGGTVDVDERTGSGIRFACASRPPVRLATPRPYAARDDHALPDPSRTHRADRQDPVRPNARDHPGRTRARAQASTSSSGSWRSGSPRSTRVRSNGASRRSSRSRWRSGSPIVERDDLIEMDAGSWTGRSLASLRRTKRWSEVQRSPSTFRFPDGESVRRGARSHDRGESGDRAATSTRPSRGRDPRRYRSHADGALRRRAPRCLPADGGRHRVGFGRLVGEGAASRPARQRRRRPRSLRTPRHPATVGDRRRADGAEPER